MKKQFTLICICVTFAILFFTQSSKGLCGNWLSKSETNFGFISLGENTSLKVEKRDEKIFISGSGFRPYETVRLLIAVPSDFDLKDEVWLVHSDINGDFASERENFSQNFGTNDLIINAQGIRSNLTAIVKISSQNSRRILRDNEPSGELWIEEHTSPPSSTSFNFTTTGLNPAAFLLVDNSTSVDPKQVFFLNPNAPRQTYTVTESNSTSYSLSDISCTYVTCSCVPVPEFTRVDRTIQIKAMYPDFVKCTFANNQIVTAANVSVGGRVLTTQGRGISNARISVTDERGKTRTVLSNPFGYYRFDELPAGQTYILQVQAKRYQFANPTQIISANEDLSGVNFTASP